MHPLDPNSKMTANIKAARDSKRPEIEDVIRVMDRFFGELRKHVDIREGSRGPDCWTWVDVSMAHLGFEKWFVVGRSAMEGTEGYPLLTLRQSTAPRLDAWVSVSSLIVGGSDLEIESSLAMGIANLAGAFEGVRQAVAQVIEVMTGGPPDMVKIIDEMSQDPEDGKKDVN